MLKPTEHLDLLQLIDLLEDKASLERRVAALSHLDTCQDCTQKHRQAEELLLLMKSDDAEEPPRDVVSMAVNLFKARQKQPGAVKRLLALLSFDSLTATPAFGVRSGLATSSRQLLYSVEDSEIDLHVTKEENSWTVVGQVLGFECQSGQVEIEGEGVHETSVVNELCEFTLPPVPPGDYKLTLRFSEIEVEVPRLELRT